MSRRFENWGALAVFLVSAYLCLFNLGYAPLWHDEAMVGVTGKNIAETGGYNGWDGRNLFLTLNGAAVNSNFKLVSYPPWQGLPSALGVLIFGANEVGVRFFHAVLGLLALGLFWLLLRLDFAHRPRLRLLAFTLFALSTQTILFFRQGRYAADAVFFALLLFYCYRLYVGRDGKPWHLAAAAAAVVLGFYNHFAIGGAFALALGAWHLLFYARRTTRRQWLEFAAAAAAVAALCAGYLIVAGIILSDEQLEFGDDSVYRYSWVKRKALMIYFNFRELLRFGWLPLWIALWFAWFALATIRRGKGGGRKSGKKRKGKSGAVSTAEREQLLEDDRCVLRWAALLALFLFFSGLLVLRAAWVHQLADSRYIVPALPFCALIIAACVDWLWRRQGFFYAAPVLAAALFSNVLAYPYLHANHFTQETVRWLLPNLVQSIHRPHENYTSEVVAYLDAHANQDDTIDVEPWMDYAVLQFYLNDKLIFCCALNEDSALPEEKVRALEVPVYEGDVEPVWKLYVAGQGEPDADKYELVYSAKTGGYPVQRPELEFHSFTPLPQPGGINIYRRRQ